MKRAVYLLILVGIIGLGAFCLGRASVKNTHTAQEEILEAMK